VAPLLGGPRSSGAPVHWTAGTPGSYATEVTYRAISDHFLKLDVAFFSHWRLEAHIPLHCHPEYWWGHSHWCPYQPKYWWRYVPGIPGGVDAYAVLPYCFSGAVQVRQISRGWDCWSPICDVFPVTQWTVPKHYCTGRLFAECWNIVDINVVMFLHYRPSTVHLLHCALNCAVYCNHPSLCVFVCLWVCLTTASVQCLGHLWALFHY